MRVRELLKRFISFVNQDVKNENETKKASVMMRLFALIMLFYLFIRLFIQLINMSLFGIVLSIFFITGFVLAFRFTYMNKTKNAMLYLTCLAVIWIFLQVFWLGWDVGAQHFVFPILVLLFVSNYTAARWKILCAVFLCIFRLFLFIYTRSHVAMFALESKYSYVIQMVTTITVFLLISSIIMVFSQDTIEMEKKLVEYNKKLKRASSVDPLTGLLNRRAMLEYINELIEKNQVYGNWFNIAIGDIDFFKKFNDTYGHEAGDEVLKATASLLEKYMQGKGKVARWGGEEFLLVFEDINGEEALIELETLRNKIKKMEIPYQEEKLRITITIGLDEYDNRKPIAYTINSADKKLYLGKQEGRDRVIF